MAVTLLNPPGLIEVPAYRQVSVGTGSRIVFIAGQVSWDENGTIIGHGDLAAQVEQCYVNVGTALAGAGATFDDVVKMTVHVVDWTPDKLPLFMEGVERAAARLGVAPVPPATLLGAAALHIPEHLVEVEAVAVLD